MTHTAEGKYWSGASGLVLPVPNKKAFPPAFRDKSRLTYYSSLFNSIEVNSSFYKVPQAATVGKWAASVPENFVFTFKLWRDITHAKGFVYDPQQVLRFMEVISPAGTKKGCLLIQFPPSLTIDKFGQVAEMLDLLQDIAPAHGWRVAVCMAVSRMAQPMNLEIRRRKTRCTCTICTRRFFDYSVTITRSLPIATRGAISD